jgi:hypothetical protein
LPSSARNYITNARNYITKSGHCVARCLIEG